jgi:hypothetical protein
MRAQRVAVDVRWHATNCNTFGRVQRLGDDVNCDSNQALAASVCVALKPFNDRFSLQ